MYGPGPHFLTYADAGCPARHPHHRLASLRLRNRCARPPMGARTRPAPMPTLQAHDKKGNRGPESRPPRSICSAWKVINFPMRNNSSPNQASKNFHKDQFMLRGCTYSATAPGPPSPTGPFWFCLVIWVLGDPPRGLLALRGRQTRDQNLSLVRGEVAAEWMIWAAHFRQAHNFSPKNVNNESGGNPRFSGGIEMQLSKEYQNNFFGMEQRKYSNNSTVSGWILPI